MKTQSFRPHAMALPRPSPLGSCPTGILTQSYFFLCMLPGPASALPTLCPLTDSHSHSHSHPVLRPETPGPLSPTPSPSGLPRLGSSAGARRCQWPSLWRCCPRGGLQPGGDLAKWGDGMLLQNSRCGS